MSGPPWHARSVPGPMVPHLDRLIQGLMDGSAYLTGMQANHSPAGVSQVYTIDIAVPYPPAAVSAMTTVIGGASIGATGATGPAGLFSPVAGPARNLKPYDWQDEHKLKDKGTSDKVLTGYRDFLLDLTPRGNMVLASRNQIVWPPRQPLQAYCTTKGLLGHDAPNPVCGCGIYAYSKPNDPHLKDLNCVWGEVALWGEVLICESGYRAEFAYPTALFLLDNGTRRVKHIGERLEQTYGVPVGIVTTRQGQTFSEYFDSTLKEFKKAKK